VKVADDESNARQDSPREVIAAKRPRYEVGARPDWNDGFTDRAETANLCDYLGEASGTI
jgi:hypothetical protein